MRKFIVGVIFTVVWAFAGIAQAQQTVWVQIEAKRSLAEAQERVRDYAGSLRNVNGFQMSSGWYAIALGPFERREADTTLLQLRATGQIPGDSFIAFANSFSRQFWPIGGAALTAQPVVPQLDLDPSPVEPVVIEPLIPTEETLQEARQSERNLTRDDRMLLQTAMKWEGFYNSGIDGAFGPGTRNAMAAWQDANRYEATGVLTSKQRNQLVTAYQDMLNSIGLSAFFDAQAGIDIELPMAMVEFDRYEPPFAHFRSKDESGVRVLLISQTGDDASLRGLFDIMQTLEIVPLEGPRDIGRNSFTLTGANDQISSHSFAQLSDGTVKGFTLIWPAGDERRRDLVIDAMRASFSPVSDAVLPDVMDDATGAQSIDLLAGLSIRQPDMSRSGFYVDQIGTVLTTSEVVASCERITLDETYEATVVATDNANGFALLRPTTQLAPINYAKFLPGVPRLNSEIAVSGYSYEGVLGAPTMTYGKLADLKGLQGELTINRLELTPTLGDAGGPVFDVSGSVFGMLLPTVQNGRKLPPEVSFAADTSGIIEFLSAQGLSAAASQATGQIAPEDLAIAAGDMTVLVSCWN